MTAISHAGADLFAGHAEDSPEAAAIARVIRHFDLIDTGDVASMVFLFAPDAIYHRPGHEPFLGRSGIRDFYTRIRPIRSGRHSLETAIAHGRNVSVHGAFRGSCTTAPRWTCGSPTSSSWTGRALSSAATPSSSPRTELRITGRPGALGLPFDHG